LCCNNVFISKLRKSGLLFNSQIFLLCFLPVVVTSYWVLARYIHAGHPGFRLLLLVASWIFYAYWDVRLLPLLIASIGVNYILISILLRAGSTKSQFLILGVTLNLAVLGFFKYFNFFAGLLPASVGFDSDRFNIILPLAISFFTFQQISALVDASKQRLHPHSLLDYALFVSFFPQLIAGPIVRHDQLVPQLQKLPNRDDIDNKIARGLLLLTLGLIKKVFIADFLSDIANPIFESSLNAGLHIIDAWTAVFAFGFQIYFDFSGYSDMAIGLALLFGIVLPINFKSPYKSQSLIDFWHRWHITLSTFLRDYLYIPLGGNRHGPMRWAVALMITMLLGGLWHGTWWTFILWGGLHGVGLIINHAWRKTGHTLPSIVGWALTFIFVMVTFLIFRAENTSSMQNLLQSMVGLNYSSYLWKFPLEGVQIDVFIAAFIVALGFPEPHELSRLEFWKSPWAAVIIAIALVSVIIFLGGSFEKEFIYFQF